MASLLGAIEGAMNVLDLPASSLRDVMAASNPLDQWLSPLSQTGRTSADELLRKYGILGKGRGPANTMAAMGAEMLLDPLNLVGVGEVKQAPVLLRALKGS